MINDRLYLIKQQTEIENLQNENENLLKDLKELSLENSTLKEKIEEKDVELSRLKGKLDKIINHVNMRDEDILRYLLVFLHDMLRYSNTYKCTVYDEYIHKFELCLLYEEDEWTGHIIDRDINDELHCIYTIYWYKNRGNTEGILKNGRMIDLDDYLQIVNLLLKDPILRKIYIESIERKDE